MIEQLDTGDNRDKTQVLKNQLFQHAPTMETCIGKLDTGLLNEKRKEESQEVRDFRWYILNITPQKVGAAQLVLVRDMDNGDFLIYDPVVEPH